MSDTWDSRSGAIVSKANNTVTTTDGMQNTNSATSTFSYDATGRLLTDARTSTALGAQSDTLSRSYDDENHTVVSSDNDTSTSEAPTFNLGSITAYNWGPTGHPIQIGSATGTASSIPSLSSVQYDTLHWDGDQLVFVTNASGQVDDIKIGTSGDITP